MEPLCLGPECMHCSPSWLCFNCGVPLLFPSSSLLFSPLQMETLSCLESGDRNCIVLYSTPQGLIAGILKICVSGSVPCQGWFLPTLVTVVWSPGPPGRGLGAHLERVNEAEDRGMGGESNPPVSPAKCSSRLKQLETHNHPMQAVHFVWTLI